MTLDINLKEKLNVMVSRDEIFDAMMTLKKGKVCGGDGITLELIQCIWLEIKDCLYDNYIWCILEGRLNP